MRFAQDHTSTSWPDKFWLQIWIVVSDIFSSEKLNKKDKCQWPVDVDNRVGIGGGNRGG